jgi:hypothetical protein
MVTPSKIDARRKECVDQCNRDDGECRSINRRGKQECSRAVAFGGNRGSARPATAACGYYGGDRCTSSMDRDACLARIAGRYQACLGVYGGSIASGVAECDSRAREADRLCLTELQECRASCQ